MWSLYCVLIFFFFFSSRRRHTRVQGDWSSDVCSSDLITSLNKTFGVVVKAFTVCAGQKENGVSRAANIKIGRVSAVNPVEVTQRNCRPSPFSLMNNSLHSQQHISHPICRLIANPRMRKGSAPGQQFDPMRYRKLHHLINACL